MLGAIIGDIVGSRFEFGPAPEENFKLFTDKCGFTDDTVCTIAVADAVLNDRPYDEALLDWCTRYPHPMGGYGNRFGSGCAMAEPIQWTPVATGRPCV